MSSPLSNWAIETTSTIGTGEITLTGPVSSSQTRFRDGLASGDIYYSIESGTSREAGIGSFDGNQRIVRSQVQATLVNGIFDTNSPNPISLNGAAIVSGTFNAEAYQSILDQVVANDVDIAAIKAENDTQNESISNNANAITANGVLIADNTTDIATNVSNITANAVAIQVNADNITSLENSGTSSQAQIDANKADIITNTNAISTNASDITTINGDLPYRETAITALETGGTLSGNGTTTILVAAGGGEVIDAYSDPEIQATTEVTWAEQTFDLLANAGMPAVTGLGHTIIGVSSLGVITAFPNGMSSAQRRAYIRLGGAEYTNRVITDVFVEPIVSNQIGNVLLDMIDFTDSKSKTKGLVLRPTALAIPDLSTWRDAGTRFGVGSNYATSKADQNVKQIPASGAVDTAVSFIPVQYNNGAIISDPARTTIDPTVYEPGGSGAGTVGNTQASIHYMIESLGGQMYMSYGQQEYDTYAEAVNNLFSDNASHKFAEEFNGMILLAQMVVLKTATIWDGVAAAIYPSGSATSSSSGSGSATQAINIGYTDTYALGVNVQSALDSLGASKLTPDQKGALDASNTPSGANAYATILDLPAAGGQVNTIVGGTNVTIDAIDPVNPIVNVLAGGQVDTVVAGTGISVNITDPVNPIITNTLVSGRVDTVVAGANTAVDSTDPANPIVSSTGSVASVVGSTNISVDVTDPVNPVVSTLAALTTVVAGTNVTINTTDARNPVISSDNTTELVLDTSPQLGGNLDCNSKFLVGSSYKAPTAVTPTTGTTHTFDFQNGDMQRVTSPAGGTLTLAFTGFVLGQVCSYIIEARNWGNSTIVWPIGVEFDSGVIPTFTVSGKDKLLVIKDRNDDYSVALMTLDSKASV